MSLRWLGITHGASDGAVAKRLDPPCAPGKRPRGAVADWASTTAVQAYSSGVWNGLAYKVRTSIKIATCNVHGINGRLPLLLQWLAEMQPDVVYLQELTPES